VRDGAEFDPFELPLGETIYRVRSAKDISYGDIQRVTGVHRNTLMRIERGERPPSVSVLLRISKALGVDMWKLVRHAQRVAPTLIRDNPPETSDAGRAAKRAPREKRAIDPHASIEEKKYRARTLLNHAVYSGEIFRLPCTVCGNKDSEGHHEDYNKPLEVIWLCSKHHGERHRVINRERSAQKVVQKTSAQTI
jgi:transcriptional regulator with XRE-family HTH domain